MAAPKSSTALAGVEAVRLLCPGHDPLSGAQADIANVSALARYMRSHPSWTLSVAQCRAADLVSEHAAAILRIAHALYLLGSLSGDEVQALFRGEELTSTRCLSECLDRGTHGEWDAYKDE
jgi:hypothetical protein